MARQRSAKQPAARRRRTSTFKYSPDRALHRAPKPGDVYVRDDVELFFHHAEKLYADWPSPTSIGVDGPYGVAGFPGDPPTHHGLADWYRPHIEAWSKHSTPETTLWFWNTEVGWATVHPVLEELGWEYRSCHVWNKGLGHVAGNANSKTLRKFPVVTEVCVQYVKPARFEVDGRVLSMKEWLRHEWNRSGLPMYLSNKACGVKNAATRKYLTQCHLWYFPPSDAFVKMANYCNKHGDRAGKPYFSLDGKRSIPATQWDRMRAKFYCDYGINNVWTEPPVRGSERLKEKGYKCVHMNQKPLRLTEIILKSCTDKRDVVWEPFGGLFSAAVAAHRLKRRCVGAEINPEFFLAACDRLATYDAC